MTGLTTTTAPASFQWLQPQNPPTATVDLMGTDLVAPQNVEKPKFEPGKVYVCTNHTHFNGVFTIVNGVLRHYWVANR